MARFTVYRNKNPGSKTVFPYLVDVQSDLLSTMETRVVIPLTRAPGLTKRPVSQLTPAIQFQDEFYVLMTPHMAGIATRDLGPSVGSLEGWRDTVMSAVDFLLSGY